MASIATENLRLKLDEISRVSSHEHSVKVQELTSEVTPYFHQPSGYCLTFALGIENVDKFRELRISIEHSVPDAEYKFVEFLIAGGHLQRDDSGRILLYFKDGVWRHAAKIAGDSAISKWGSHSVYKHPAMIVPASYGDPERYAWDANQDALKLFEDFVDQFG